MAKLIAITVTQEELFNNFEKGVYETFRDDIEHSSIFSPKLMIPSHSRPLKLFCTGLSYVYSYTVKEGRQLLVIVGNEKQGFLYHLYEAPRGLLVSDVFDIIESYKKAK